MLRHNYEIGQLKKLVKNSSKVTKDEFLSHIGVYHTAKIRCVPGGTRKKWYRQIDWVSARRIEPSEQQKHNEIA
jgi:hypothetical protein